MTPAELLVLSFLAFHPPPVCTFAFPQGDVLAGKSCPANNSLNGYGLYATVGGLRRCVPRFRI